MIERKFIPLVVAVFVLTAGLSGSATVAVLSDSETVNVQISPDNVTATVVDNASAPAEENLTATETQNATEEVTIEDVDGLIVELEPTDETTISPGETAEYDVYVRGATEGIVSYDVILKLSNSSVASFENFDHKHNNLTLNNETVTDDRVEVDGASGTNKTISGVEREGTTVTKIGQVTVNGTVSGETDLTIKDTVGIVGPIDGEDKNYNISQVNGGTLVVRDG
jgi:predicted ribosomally synthesized peptide with SipW-like signal peptide